MSLGSVCLGHQNFFCVLRMEPRGAFTTEPHPSPSCFLRWHLTKLTEAGLELSDPPASASGVAGKHCHVQWSLGFFRSPPPCLATRGLVGQGGKVRVTQVRGTQQNGAWGWLGGRV